MLRNSQARTKLTIRNNKLRQRTEFVLNWQRCFHFFMTSEKATNNIYNCGRLRMEQFLSNATLLADLGVRV